MAPQRDLHTMAAWLSAVTGSRVELAFAATGTPRVADAVAALRRRGSGRVVVASYLLSEGLFQDRLRASGAELVTEPLGTHPGLVRLIAQPVQSCPLFAGRLATNGVSTPTRPSAVAPPGEPSGASRPGSTSVKKAALSARNRC